MRKSFIPVLLIILLFNSCSNDLDITADYKEVAIIYGLLNAADSIHYIQVYKGFLDEKTSALELAKNPDSLYYQDSIRVKLEGGGQQFYLKKVQLPPKEEGIFAESPNYAYMLEGNISQDAQYNLTVENLRTGKTFTSSTPIVKDFQIEFPQQTFPVNFTSTTPLNVRWKSAVNGRIYELRIRFYYEEWNINNPNAVDTQFVEWKIFGEKLADNDLGGQTLTYNVNGKDFYSFLASRLEVDQDLRRNALQEPLEFVLFAGADEVYNYIRVNRAQTGITQLQAKPQYTNIEGGGLGLFSSRYNKSLTGVLLSERSLDSLSCGSVTGDLNFVNSSCN